MRILIVILLLLSCSSISGTISKAQKKKELKVLIIDSGLSIQYPEILKYVQNMAKDQLDNDGHGTHVTSTILKEACPEVKIYVCKDYDKKWLSDKKYNTYIKCLKSAIDLKVDLINFSGGGYGIQDYEELNILKQFKDNGITLVAAAGNDGRDNDIKPFYPASYKLSNVISIGNLNKDGKPNPSSNFGDRVTWFPGTEIEAYSTEGLEKMTGTSMAAANYTNSLVKRFCKGLK